MIGLNETLASEASGGMAKSALRLENKLAGSSSPYVSFVHAFQDVAF